jgi:serine phosphatase RsbU (regulator of sigma subunit)
MPAVLFRLGKRLSPAFAGMTAQERAYWLGDAFGLAYSAPLALLGLAWLAARTRLETAAAHWPVFFLALALVAIFRRFNFFGFTEIRTGLYADWGGSFDSLAAWSAALVLGPVAFWPGLLLYLAGFLMKWREYSRANMRLPRLRRLTLAVACDSLLPVLALSLYERWGGDIPLPGIGSGAILPAVFAALLWYLLSSLLYLPYFILTFIPPSASLPAGERLPAVRAVAWLYIVMDLLPALLGPFAVLSAGMYGVHGFGMYALLLSGLVLPAYLANRLSMAAERSYHRSRELERLERLSTAIIDAPSDASTLPDLLREHVPGMFPDSQVEVRLFPGTTLLRSSQDFLPVAGAVWDWLQNGPAPEPRCFLSGEAHPWNGARDGSACVLAPIYSLSSGALIGGVCVVVKWWPDKIIPYFLPAVQSLATLVSSALNQAEVTAQMLANERVVKELALAGEIQAGLLPQELPQPPGWQIAAVLEPTRETSGDFYDVIPLPSGRLGIVIADVADKGMGAALYMTLSRTLIRTYAVEHEQRPDLVLRAVNGRLMADSRAVMFVTVFYGVLDPLSGRLDYCNAGHNPPLLFHPHPRPVAPGEQNETNYWFPELAAEAVRSPAATVEVQHQALERTGMALGMLEEAPLNRETVILQPGAVLVLYTDGVTEAGRRAGEFFEVERVVEAAQDCLDCPAQDMLDGLLGAVHNFVGEVGQEDDVTVMVVRREGERQI